MNNSFGGHGGHGGGHGGHGHHGRGYRHIGSRNYGGFLYGYPLLAEAYCDPDTMFCHGFSGDEMDLDSTMGHELVIRHGDLIMKHGGDYPDIGYDFDDEFGIDNLNSMMIP